jgi:Protein of unknown function (DUF2971).
VINKKLKLKRPNEWEDPYENILFKCFENELYFTNIIDIFNSYNIHSSTSEINVFLISIYVFTNTTYCACFTKEVNGNDSDAMWRSYSFNNQSVRIELCSNNMKNNSFLYNGEKYSTTTELIDYTNNSNFENIVLEASKLDTYMCAFNKKRESFRYENEERLVAIPNSNPSLLKTLIKTVELDKHFSDLDDFKRRVNLPYMPKEVYMDIDLKDIAGVLLNPHAKDSINYAVRKLCEENKILYLGKSKLYTFK